MGNESSKILIVEDDKLTALLNKRPLSSYGKVIAVNNLKDAHRVLTTEKFDVGFFDLNLAGELDGHRLITPELLPARISSNIGGYKGIVTDEHLDLVEEMGLKDFLATFKKQIILALSKRHN